MFNPNALEFLLNKHELTFRKLLVLEKLLNRRFVGMGEAIHALVLAVASGEPLLLIGPPGTAKSRLVRAFCSAIGLIDEVALGTSADGGESENHQDGYFEYLLTPFTEPGELFGFYDIARLQAGQGLERHEEGMMQHAEVVFLDEVFNASSAILNSLLSVMNERIFHDRGERKRVAMRCFVGAANQVPEAPELKAFYDRFLLRSEVENVGGVDQKLADDIGQLIAVGWRETYGRPEQDVDLGSLLDDVARFRHHVRELTTEGRLLRRDETESDPWPAFLKNLAGRVVQAREYDLSEVSNRRLIKMTFIMLVHRLLRAVYHKEKGELVLGGEELDLLHRFFLDRKEEDAVRRMERQTQSLPD